MFSEFLVENRFRRLQLLHHLKFGTKIVYLLLLKGSLRKDDNPEETKLTDMNNSAYLFLSFPWNVYKIPSMAIEILRVNFQG